MKVQALFTIDVDVKKRLDHWADFDASGVPRAKRLNKSELLQRLILDFLREYDSKGEHLADVSDNKLAALLIRDMKDCTLRSLLVDFIRENNRKMD